jgi:hypothetical protein
MGIGRRAHRHEAIVLNYLPQSLQPGSSFRVSHYGQNYSEWSNFDNIFGHLRRLLQGKTKARSFGFSPTH